MTEMGSNGYFHSVRAEPLCNEQATDVCNFSGHLS